MRYRVNLAIPRYHCNRKNSDNYKSLMTKLSNSNFEAAISGCFLKRAIQEMKLYCEVIEHQYLMESMIPDDLLTAIDELEYIKEELVEKKERTVC